MGINKILPFAQGVGANVLSDVDYAALTALLANGFLTGTALSVQLNKVWRQSSSMAVGLAEFIASNQAQNVSDDLSAATMAGLLEDAITTFSAGNFAALAGSASQAFSVAAATANNHAVSRTFGDGRYAALAGLSTQAFSCSTLDVGHASDTTITRVSAGVIAVEGVNILTTATGMSGTYASTAEAQAQTSNTTVISPLRLKEALKGANQSLAASGYQNLPGGLLLQWGYSATRSVNVATLSYPIAFPVACVGVYMTEQRSSAHNANFNLNAAPGVTSFSVWNDTGDAPLFWFAIGY